MAEATPWTVLGQPTFSRAASSRGFFGRVCCRRHRRGDHIAVTPTSLMRMQSGQTAYDFKPNNARKSLAGLSTDVSASVL